MRATTDPATAVLAGRFGAAGAAPWLCATVALLDACGRPALLPEHGHEPPAVQDACSRTELKCSSCHTLDRILSYQRRGRTDWAQEVKRMRLKPASGITVADADVIVTCLTYIDTIRPPADLGLQTR